MAMVSIDPKALEHACLSAGRSVYHFDRMGDDLPLRSSIIAHARAIEQHEAFKREVSDAVEEWHGRWVGAGESHSYFMSLFARFILPAPDPLVEVFREMDSKTSGTVTEEGYADEFRAALAARGYEVRKIEHTPPAGGSDASSS